LDPRAIQKKHWEQFAEEVGIKPRLVLTRALDMARKIQAACLQLFKGAFAPYKCDALYRLMELMGEQAEKPFGNLRKCYGLREDAVKAAFLKMPETTGKRPGVDVDCCTVDKAWYIDGF